MVKIWSAMKTLKSMEAIRDGGRAELSTAEITSMVVNLFDAKKNLNKDEFKKVQSLYKELEQDTKKDNMDIIEYLDRASKIVKRFDLIADYSYYKGD